MQRSASAAPVVSSDCDAGVKAEQRALEEKAEAEHQRQDDEEHQTLAQAVAASR